MHRSVFLSKHYIRTSDADNSLGNFLLQNYKQALHTQVALGRELLLFESATCFSTMDFLRWHREEIAFLSIAKRKEPDETSLKVSYVEALEKVFAIE